MSGTDGCANCGHIRHYHYNWAGGTECDVAGCGCGKFLEPIDYSPNEPENVEPQPTHEDSGEPKLAKEDQ